MDQEQVASIIAQALRRRGDSDGDATFTGATPTAAPAPGGEALEPAESQPTIQMVQQPYNLTIKVGQLSCYSDALPDRCW